MIDNKVNIDYCQYVVDIKSYCAGCFEGLSSKTRIKIVNLLKERKTLTAGEIVNNFDLTQPTISHHLKYLKECGILASKREGKNINYFISPRCNVHDCGILERETKNA